jgi:hypothetical protein
LTVYGPDGEGYWGAIVALYKQDGRVIGQGFTDGNGQLAIYGATEGDTLRAAAFDGGLAGEVAVDAAPSLSLTLAPVSGLATQATAGIPHLRVIAEPSQNPNQIDLLIFLPNFGPNASPGLIVTEPGSEIGHAPSLSYSPSTDTYQGQVNFNATEQGTGRLQVLAAGSNSLIRRHSTYRLQHALNNQSQTVYSDDGNLSLYLESGSLPGNQAYFVVMPPGAVPGGLPSNLALIGDPYDITASGSLATLKKPAVLALRYDGALVNPTETPTGMSIYWWNPDNQLWQKIGGDVDVEHDAMIAPVTALGIYALLAPPDSWIERSQEAIFLPNILKKVSLD